MDALKRRVKVAQAKREKPLSHRTVAKATRRVVATVRVATLKEINTSTRGGT